jgi:hypothetical protein
LPVRMGIATGEAELREGDYVGTVLNRAARVMAAGHGGQILVADSTAVLLTGTDLLELGPRRLRDVSAPVEVFQTIAGFAFNPITAAWHAELDIAIAHLREVLGDQIYESLARKGETMTITAMVTYTYDQIDQARAELKAVAK